MASRILLADDSITIQKVVNLTFADEGIEVVAVSNGDIAERRLPEVSPDLVLADIFMPGKNGYELCEAIKENSQFCNVPVVLLVGAFEPFDSVEARRVRADAHLTKPFESRTLVETVRRLISASGRSTTVPISAPPSADEENDELLDALAPATTAPALASPPPAKLDLTALAADSPAESNVAPFTLPRRTTGELASPAPDRSQEVLDLGFVDAPTLEAATLSDSSEPFGTLELSPNGDFAASEPSTAAGVDAQEMIQDFDKSVAVEAVASQDPISFQTEPSALLDVDISGAGEGEDWFNRSSFDTTRLEPSGDAGWQAPATGSPLSYQSSDFNLQTDVSYAASEASNETACATLLAVDEPLGDVLFDEGRSVGQMAISQPPSVDSLALDFAEPEAVVTEAGARESTQFALVESADEPRPEASFGFDERSEQVESIAVEEPVESIQVEETRAQVDETHTHEAPVVAATYPTADVESVSRDAANDLDWTTPRAATYSTAQLDSIVMPIAGVEYAAEASVDEQPELPPETDAAETAEEARFSTATMWTEEEARFTPIDIEAVAVEAPADEIGEVETGFAVASVLTEEPATKTEVPAGSADAEAVDQAPHAAAGLSSAAIEQIVRRVVAEMSESVVREVAWEVVPDCVERVIEQLTRESLSKRA